MAADKLTLGEMARRLSITPKTLKKHLDEKGVSYLKIGNRVLVCPLAVEEAFTHEPETVIVPAKPKLVPVRGRFAGRLGL